MRSAISRATVVVAAQSPEWQSGFSLALRLTIWRTLSASAATGSTHESKIQLKRWPWDERCRLQDEGWAEHGRFTELREPRQISREREFRVLRKAVAAAAFIYQLPQQSPSCCKDGGSVGLKKSQFCMPCCWEHSLH